MTGLCEGASLNDSFVISLQGFFWASSKHEDDDQATLTGLQSSLCAVLSGDVFPFLSLFILPSKNLCLCSPILIPHMRTSSYFLFNTNLFIFVPLLLVTRCNPPEWLAYVAKCLCWHPITRPERIYYCAAPGGVVNNQVRPMPLLPSKQEYSSEGAFPPAERQPRSSAIIKASWMHLKHHANTLNTAYGGSPKTKLAISSEDNQTYFEMEQACLLRR